MILSQLKGEVTFAVECLILSSYILFLPCQAQPFRSIIYVALLSWVQSYYLSFIFSPLPCLNSFPFHCLPDFKKWDIVTSSTQHSVHINVNYFWECDLFFPNLEQDLWSSFPVILRFSLFPRGCHESWQRLSGEAWGLSPSKPSGRLLYRAWCQPHLWTQCFWVWLTIHSPLLGQSPNAMVIIHCRGTEWTERSSVWWIVLHLVTIPAFLFAWSSS